MEFDPQKWFKKFYHNLTTKTLVNNLISDLAARNISASEIKLYSKEKAFNNELTEIFNLMASDSQNDRELAQTKLTKMNPDRRSVMMAAIATIVSKNKE